MKTEFLKKIRRIAVIVVVAMSLLLLTACGGNGEKDAFAAFSGEWAADVSSYNGILIHEDGSWELYKNGGLYSTGELDYHSEDDSVWISPDNNTQWSRLSIEDDGSLYAAPIGYFLPGEISLDDTPVEEEAWNEDTDDDWYDSGMEAESGDISEYAGMWEYVDEDVWILIYEDETWECLDAEGYAFQSGTVSVDSTGITFYSDDIDGELRFDRTLSGDLIETENGGMLVPADSIPVGDSIDITAYAGCWEYPDGTVLEIDNDTWYLYEADEYLMVAWGVVEFDADAAYLMNDEESSAVGAVYFDEDGDLIDSSGDVLTYLGLSIAE